MQWYWKNLRKWKPKCYSVAYFK